LDIIFYWFAWTLNDIKIYKDFLVHIGNHMTDMFSTQKGLKQKQALST